MDRRIVIAALLAAAVHVGMAAGYSTQRLRRIAAAVRVAVPDDIGANASDDSTYSYGQRQLRLRTDSRGDVSHIGYRLFNSEIMRMQGQLPVFDFVERYLLELDLALDGRKAAERMDIDRVRIVKGSLPMFGSVSDTTALSIEYIPRRMYRLTWTVKGKPLAITVPADCQLLRGADAVELEDMLVRDMPRLSPADALASPLSYWDRARRYEHDGMRILDNGCYLSRMIGSKLYMERRDGKWQLCRDRARAARSVLNVMLTGVSGGDTRLELAIDKYGHKTAALSTTLARFIAFCRDEGCEVYGGIKTVGDGEVAGTLFIPNERLGYNHVLSFTFPLGNLSGADKPVKARLYAYIPLQNVTEKFFTQDLIDDNYDK